MGLDVQFNFLFIKSKPVFKTRKIGSIIDGIHNGLLILTGYVKEFLCSAGFVKQATLLSVEKKRKKQELGQNSAESLSKDKEDATDTD